MAYLGVVVAVVVVGRGDWLIYTCGMGHVLDTNSKEQGSVLAIWSPPPDQLRVRHCNDIVRTVKDKLAIKDFPLASVTSLSHFQTLFNHIGTCPFTLFIIGCQWCQFKLRNPRCIISLNYTDICLEEVKSNTFC